jgi:hypothetical protein
MGRPTRAKFLLLALLLAVIPATGASARALDFHGRAITVPRGWRVYDLARDPETCVRLDRPVVYVGTPSPAQRCPAHAVGRSRAILVEPRGPRAVVLHGPRAVAPSGGGAVGGTAPMPTPTPAPVPKPGPIPGPSGAGSVAGATYSGLGFDACSAPTPAQMAAWKTSPYRATGIYLGGTNMACAQPNLSAAWVSQESAAGWHLIPTYVGLQAPSNSCGCSAISPGKATAQGVAAANDAVAHARALGLGPGNPIYDDMEYYDRTGSNTPAVLAFLSGWTAQLHASGYRSAVYGNSDSVIADLLTREGTGYPEPDDIWFAEWNDAHTVSSSLIPSGFWVGRRLHQYSGGVNVTYGGVTINIDGDALDGATAAAGGFAKIASPFPEGTFVQVSGTKTVYRVAGGAPLLVNSWTAFGTTPQPYKVISSRQFALLDPVPSSGTFLKTATGTAYRVAGGAALPITNTALFPGLASAVIVDPWDLAHPSSPRAHLAARPADGTIVEGLPSRSYWVFDGRARRTVSPSSTATQVDDDALSAFPIVPCLVPGLRGLTLTQARAVLQAADCATGNVHRRRTPPPHQFLHVARQFPGPNARRAALTPVALTLN